VITDALMPVMDGYEFFSQLRLDPEIGATPVLFYAAPYSERDARALAPSSGASWILTTPSDEILEIVSLMLAAESKARTPSDIAPLAATVDREPVRRRIDSLPEQSADLRIVNARLRGLIDIGLELAPEQDSDRLLRRVCVAARDLFCAAYVTLGSVDPTDRTVQRAFTCGTDTACSVGGVDWIETGNAVPGILGTVVAERRACRGDNPGGDPAGLQLPSLHPDVHAFLATPIVSPAHVYGWLCFVANAGRAFTEDDEYLAMALSAQVGRFIERNQAIETMRVAEERMRFALESAGVGIWDMDYATGVTQWSTILESLYGLQPGTFDGTLETVVGCVHPDDRASLLETIGKATRSGGDFSTQHRSIWPDGTVRWLNGAGRIHLGEHGEPVRAIGIAQDITDRLTLESRYQQAQKMEVIGQLAGGVAHDFNNMLTVILGFSEMLLADLDPDDPSRADADGINKAGLRGAGLTRQLLAFSRKQIIEPTLLDLNVVVAEMRAMLGRLIEEDVTVVLGLLPDPTRMTADRGQVEQIVLNLALNARDAMSSGGTLTIETADADLDEHYAMTHPAVKPGSYVALRVTDTGAGMTAQVQARLFEPFFTTKPVGKGTGLGLATVQGIVARSGGSIDVSSEVGKGSCFTVYFPKADAAEMAADAPPPVARRRAGAETVLVVEDAKELREVATRLLRWQGYTVLVAANADEALRLFEQHGSIDVLLTDVVMPGASGPELTRQLVERYPTLKVVYMSGYTEDAIVQHGVLNAGIALLHKPFTSETLGRKIREALAR
jgi:PAS domain S-box-containing protein